MLCYSKSINLSKKITTMKNKAFACKLFLLASGLLLIQPCAFAAWKIKAGANSFYTSDVSIFSASQRLSLSEDPTSPIIDKTGRGSSFVFEPTVFLGRSFQNTLGKLEVRFNAQGYIFTSNSEFNHGTYGANIVQTLSPKSSVGVRYHFGPGQFLGESRATSAESEEIENSSKRFGKERVTTHFGSLFLQHRLTDRLLLRLLGRYGNRTYSETFSQRDTNFWTVGPHLEWEINPYLELLLGYHFERGLAAGRHQPQFGENVSYFNHYATGELAVKITENTSLRLGFDYEKNIFTSKLREDDHRNGGEDVYQGDIQLRHKATKRIDLILGYLHGQRKFTFESSRADVNTAWLGINLKF